MIKRLPETSLMTIKAMIREHEEINAAAINFVDMHWNYECKKIYQAPGMTLTVDIYQQTCEIDVFDRELMVNSLHDKITDLNDNTFLGSEIICIENMFKHKNDDCFEAYLEEYVRCIKEFISNMQHVFDKYSLATWIQNNPYNFKKWAVDEDTCELFRLV